MSKLHTSQKWYQQKRWIIGSLLLFPPLGIPLLWLTGWPRAGKIGGSIFSGIILLTVLTGESGKPTVASVEPPTVEAVNETTAAAPITTAAYEDAIAEAAAATEELAAAESSADWERIARQWQSALSSLGDIPISSGDYRQAQAKIAEYERDYDYAISQKAVVEAANVEAEAQQQAATQESETVISVVEAEGSYVSGTCKELRASGVGSDFRPGDANYTSARDRDGDGVACES